MVRVIVVAGLLSVPLLAAGPPQQNAAADAAFEIASIKPGFPEGADIRAYAEGAGNCAFYVFTPKGNRFYQGRVTLCMLIRMAYEVTDIQIVGLPGWANQMNRAAWYEVEGLAAEGTTLTIPQARAMLRTLLADRFKLKVRREQREARAYGLVVDGSGHKLSTTDIPCPVTGPGAKLFRTFPTGTLASCTPQVEMSRLVFALGRIVDRLVVDQTGLTGRYALNLQFASTDPLNGTDGLPSLFTALREQAGLRLEPRSHSIDALVIDYVEPPTPN